MMMMMMMMVMMFETARPIMLPAFIVADEFSSSLVHYLDHSVMVGLVTLCEFRTLTFMQPPLSAMQQKNNKLAVTILIRYWM